MELRIFKNMIEIFEATRKVHKHKKTHKHYLVPAFILMKYYGEPLESGVRNADFEWLCEMNDSEYNKTTICEDFKNEKTGKISKVEVTIKEQIETTPPLFACTVDPEPK